MIATNDTQLHHVHNQYTSSSFPQDKEEDDAPDTIDVNSPTKQSITHVERPRNEMHIGMIPEDPPACDGDNVRRVQGYLPVQFQPPFHH